MKNPEIINMARMLGKTSETIELLVSSAIESGPYSNYTDEYGEMVLDELQHAHDLVLMMTKELGPGGEETHDPQYRGADETEEE